MITGIDDTCSVPGGGLFYASGPATGWYIHSDPSSPGQCHLYTLTTANVNPQQRAAYYLPVDAAHNGFYVVDAWVNCEHNNARMKYYVYLNGSGGGISFVTNREVLSVCDNWARVVARVNFNAQLGGYVQLVDNTGSSSTWQNADMVYYWPS